jgi:ADP-ribose pyrophosphatase YjhB (NUDIX family)
VIKLKELLENKDSKNVAGIAYFFNDTLLCCQNNEGRWGIPKGHIHINETTEEGAYREFTEETQIILNTPIKFSHKAKKNNGSDFSVFMCKGDKKFTAHINNEHKDWGYFPIHKLPTPFDERVIKVIDNISEASTTFNIKGMKGATGFIKPEDWDAKIKSLEKAILKSTGYTMLKMKPLLERVDFQDEASEMIKAYGLKSKLKIGRGKDFGEYVPEKDLITMRPMYKSIKDFLLTILHEIGHALDAKRLGVKKYIKKYTQAGTMANYKGLDPHDDNKWEEKAEKFARKELNKWLVVTEVSSNSANYSAESGEKDTGFLPKKGMKRELGVNQNKPEPWFEKGGYTQIDFPESDQIYDTKDKNVQIIQVIKKISNLGDKYEGFQDDIASWDKYGYKDFSLDFEEFK